MYDLTKTLDNVQEQKNKPVSEQDPIFAQDILDDDEFDPFVELGEYDSGFDEDEINESEYDGETLSPNA